MAGDDDGMAGDDDGMAGGDDGMADDDEGMAGGGDKERLVMMTEWLVAVTRNGW